MCDSKEKVSSKRNYTTLLYVISTLLGILASIYNIQYIDKISFVISEIFMRIFRCISVPVIFTALLSTIITIESNIAKKITPQIVFYATITTFISAIVACILYIVIAPTQLILNPNAANTAISNDNGYLEHIINLIPSHLYEPFLGNNVIGALILAITLGIAARKIDNTSQRKTFEDLIIMIRQLLMVVTSWVIKILPIGIFAFTVIAMDKFKINKLDIVLIKYLAVIIGANLIQGFIILPIILFLHKIKSFKLMRDSLPALSTAFFSKSSSGTLPITIDIAEKKLGIKEKFSKLILPLCTTLNMNGCSAFICATTLFVMESNGISISGMEKILWIVVATVAALGNAGVPMGCFFLSLSILSSMKVDIALMSIILPFYTIIDMIETSLNVWSDICITKIINDKNLE